MKERIRKVREHFGLSMEKFGSRIGIGKTSVSLLESGKNNPSTQTVALICREFGVNEQWLRTGEGEMFEQTRETVLDKLCAEYGLDERRRAVIEGFLDLTEKEQEAVLQYLHNVFDRAAAPTTQNAAVPDKEAQRIAESDEYKSLVEKKEQAEEESSTSVG